MSSNQLKTLPQYMFAGTSSASGTFDLSSQNLDVLQPTTFDGITLSATLNLNSNKFLIFPQPALKNEPLDGLYEFIILNYIFN